MILVKKGDARALKFDQIKDGKAPEGEWPLTLSSHPGRAIIRGPDPKHKGHPGE